MASFVFSPLFSIELKCVQLEMLPVLLDWPNGLSRAFGWTSIGLVATSIEALVITFGPTNNSSSSRSNRPTDRCKWSLNAGFKSHWPKCLNFSWLDDREVLIFHQIVSMLKRSAWISQTQNQQPTKRLQGRNVPNKLLPTQPVFVGQLDSALAAWCLMLGTKQTTVQVVQRISLGQKKMCSRRAENAWKSGADGGKLQVERVGALRAEKLSVLRA